MDLPWNFPLRSWGTIVTPPALQAPSRRTQPSPWGVGLKHRSPSKLLRTAERRKSRKEDLHFFEVLEVSKKRPRRCSCGARLLRRPKCLSLVDLYRPWSERADSDGTSVQDKSELISQFLQRKPHVWAALLRSEYHTWHSQTKKFHKELSESVATIEAWLAVKTPRQSHVVDLCCGKSLTSVLLSLDSHGQAITAIDWRDPCELPHHEETLVRHREHEEAAYADVPVTYLQHDVLADDFLDVLAQRIETVGRPTAILGMHLCGRLSLQAIDAFRQIDLVQSLVLTPCCLPHSSEAPEELQEIYGIGLSDPEQFTRWADYLEKLLETTPQTRVNRRVENGILSSRRTMFVAIKTEPT